jgi:hypothetical protein
MKNWKLTSLIVWLAITLLPIPHALAGPVDCNFFDNCNGQIVGAPEPGTFLLLGSGLAGLAGIAWRRHRRK